MDIVDNIVNSVFPVLLPTECTNIQKPMAIKDRMINRTIRLFIRNLIRKATAINDKTIVNNFIYIFTSII